MYTPFGGKDSTRSWWWRTGRVKTGVSTMSEYLGALDPLAQAKYMEKLKLVGLSENEDLTSFGKGANLRTT